MDYFPLVAKSAHFDFKTFYFLTTSCLLIGLLIIKHFGAVKKVGSIAVFSSRQSKAMIRQSL